MSRLDKPTMQIPVGMTPDGRPVMFSAEFFRLVSALYERAGGTLGLSTTDVDAGSYAAMQPAVFDACHPDVMQGAGASGDLAQETAQIDFVCQPMADIYQG